VHNNNRDSLIKHRLEQAHKCLDEAVLLIDAGAYSGSANRSYYCIFHAMRAVHAIDGFDSKKHSGVISAFRQNYIKTGIFPTHFSDIIQDSFDTRGSSDYDDFFMISKDDVIRQIDDMKVFLSAVEDYLTLNILNNEK